MTKGVIKAEGFYINLYEDNLNYYKFKTKKIVEDLSNFNFIFLRQDPPFNMNYITSTYLLDLIPENTKIINNPTSVRNFSEKIFPFKFRQYMPPTIVSQNLDNNKKFFISSTKILLPSLFMEMEVKVFLDQQQKITALNGFNLNKNILDAAYDCSKIPS